MIFEYNGKYFVACMSHCINGVVNTIDVIADTACTNSVIGSRSLAELLNIDVEDLRCILVHEENALMKQVESGDGNYHMIVRSELRGLRFVEDPNKGLQSLGLLVNIQDEPIKHPCILLGLDFLLMFDRCILRDNKLECFNFDEDKYYSMLAMHGSKTANLYSLLNITPQVIPKKSSNLADLLQQARGD